MCFQSTFAVANGAFYGNTCRPKYYAPKLSGMIKVTVKKVKTSRRLQRGCTSLIYTFLHYYYWIKAAAKGQNNNNLHCVEDMICL